MIQKLLKIGNPQFWGRIYNITLKDGLLKQGKLIRVNWTMKYGKVVGSCYLLENKLQTVINLEDVSGIELLEKHSAAFKAADTQPAEKNINITANSKPKIEFTGVDIIE